MPNLLSQYDLKLYDKMAASEKVASGAKSNELSDIVKNYSSASALAAVQKEEEKRKAILAEDPFAFYQGPKEAMVDPTGKVVNTPVDLHNDLTSKGFKTQVDFENEKAMQANAQGLGGTFAAAGSSFLNSLGMGTGEYIANAAFGDDTKKYLEAAKAAHPIASGLGTVAGIGADTALMAATGGASALGEGAALATRGIANPLLRAGAKTGLEGLAYSLPHAAAKAVIDKDPLGAAQELALGGGLGGLMGAGGELLSQGASKLASGIKQMVSGPVVDEAKGELAFRSLSHGRNVSKRQTAKIDTIYGGVDKFGNELLEQDLTPRIGEKFKDYTARLEQERDVTGKAISNAYKAVTDADLTMNADDLRKKIYDKAFQPIFDKYGHYPSFDKKGNPVRELYEDINAGLDKYAKNGEISASDAWQVTRDIESYVKKFEANANNPFLKENPEVMDRVLADSVNELRSSVRDHMQLSLEALEQADPAYKGMLQAYNTNNRKYMNIMDARGITRETETKMGANNIFSLTDQISGAAGKATGVMSNILSGSISGAVGGLAGMGVGLASGAATTIMHKLVRENGAAIAAQTLKQLGNMQLPNVANRAISSFYQSQVPEVLNAFTRRSTSSFASNVFSSNPKSKNEELESLSQMINSTKLNDVDNQLSKLDPNSVDFHVLSTYRNTLANLQANDPFNKMKVDVLSPSQAKKPDQRELDRYKNRILIVNNPYSYVFDKLHSGTFTAQDLQMLSELNPKVKNELTSSIQAWVNTNPDKFRKMDSNQKQSINLFLKRGASTQAFQASYQPQQNQQPQPPPIQVDTTQLQSPANRTLYKNN